MTKVLIALSLVFSSQFVDASPKKKREPATSYSDIAYNLCYNSKAFLCGQQKEDASMMDDLNKELSQIMSSANNMCTKPASGLKMSPQGTCIQKTCCWVLEY